MELPIATDRLIGASCSLDAAELRRRLADWRLLVDRSLEVDIADDSVRLRLRADQALDEVSRLVTLESACCPFYRFTIRVEGPDRALEIDAGPGGAPAVRALLGLPE